MYETILLPTDGSAGMDRVIDHAASLAAVHGATLHALYVIDTASLADLPMETSWDGVRTALREEGERALAAVADRVEGVPLRTDLVEGAPGSDIVSMATEQDIDLIVMGTHGRGGIDRWILGSVAERVVRESSVPVLTIRVE